MSTGRLKIAFTAEDLLVIKAVIFHTQNYTIGYSTKRRAEIHDKIEKAFQDCDVKIERKKEGE